MKLIKPDKGTIIRTVVLLLTLINTALYVLGKPALEISETALTDMIESIYTAITTVSVVVVPIWTWWKNNSFTPQAQAGDMVMRTVKAELENEKLEADDFEGVI